MKDSQLLFTDVQYLPGVINSGGKIGMLSLPQKRPSFLVVQPGMPSLPQKCPSFLEPTQIQQILLQV